MGDYNKHVIIVGTARSGTSWLAETIAKQYRYRMIFEPEHEFNTKKGYLLSDQWIQQPNDSPDAHAYLKKVFANRVDCDWIAQCSNRKFKRHLWPFIPKRFIIKFVRANLAANYMNQSFGIPVVHILRNPYDVIRSQQQVKFPWLYNLKHFYGNKELVSFIKSSFDYDLESQMTSTPLEQLTLRWCIENMAPLKFKTTMSTNYHILKYETLRDDIQVFYKLCKKLNLEPIGNLETHYKQPSSKTHPQSSIIMQRSSPTGFNSEEFKSINTILDIFKVDFYPREF